jgi:hypothetical protein
VRVNKICGACGETFRGYEGSTNIFCKACYIKKYCELRKSLRKEKVCVVCKNVFLANSNNQFSLCPKCTKTNMNHKYYIEVTKPGRVIERLIKKGLM